MGLEAANLADTPGSRPINRHERAAPMARLESASYAVRVVRSTRLLDHCISGVMCQQLLCLQRCHLHLQLGTAKPSLCESKWANNTIGTRVRAVISPIFASWQDRENPPSWVACFCVGQPVGQRRKGAQCCSRYVCVFRNRTRYSCRSPFRALASILTFHVR